jgi:AraC-like DNA-binding protein
MVWDIEDLPDARLAAPPPRFTFAFLRPLTLALGRLGIDTAAFLARLDVADGTPATAVAAIPVLEALETIAWERRTPHLGIEIVRNLPLGAFGLADYRFSASAVLLEAFANFEPRQDEFGQVTRYQTTVADGLARTEMVPLFRFSELHPVAESIGMAFVVRRLRDVLGDAVVKLTAARFVCPAPATKRVYDDFFGVPVEFGADSYELVFPSRLLEAPLLTANPQIAKVLAERLPSARSAPESADAFVNRVRDAIAACLESNDPILSINDVSTRLGLTPRSLQRKLRDKGVSFTGLVDAARLELAQELLAREGTLLCEIAYRLGFSGVTPFFRAFRRWTGTSPREFQRDQGERE